MRIKIGFLIIVIFLLVLYFYKFVKGKEHESIFVRLFFSMFIALILGDSFGVIDNDYNDALIINSFLGYCGLVSIIYIATPILFKAVEEFKKQSKSFSKSKESEKQTQQP